MKYESKVIKRLIKLTRKSLISWQQDLHAGGVHYKALYVDMKIIIFMDSKNKLRLLVNGFDLSGNPGNKNLIDKLLKEIEVYILQRDYKQMKLNQDMEREAKVYNIWQKIK